MKESLTIVDPSEYERYLSLPPPATRFVNHPRTNSDFLAQESYFFFFTWSKKVLVLSGLVVVENLWISQIGPCCHCFSFNPPLFLPGWANIFAPWSYQQFCLNDQAELCPIQTDDRLNMTNETLFMHLLIVREQVCVIGISCVCLY